MKNSKYLLSRDKGIIIDDYSYEKENDEYGTNCKDPPTSLQNYAI